MNILGTLLRLVCSWLLLLIIAVYAGTPAHIAPESFIGHINLDTLSPLFTSFNWVSITAIVLLVLSILRIQEMLWNVCFAAAFMLCIVFGACFIADPATILPSALEGNRVVLDFCYLPKLYPIPAIVIISIFAMGWLCSTAPFRIMFTCVLSFALWFGCTEVFHYMIGMWAKSPDPSMPELLHAAQTAPWISAAIPGAFFLVYALLMAFIETFISRREQERRKRAEKAAAEAAQAEAAAAAAEAEQILPEPVEAPQLPPVPAAAPKTEEKPVAKPAAEAPKIEEKPADKPAAEAPKTEEKPADKPAAEAPKTEEKPTDKPAAEAPKTEEKPTDKPTAEAPKAEEKPADKPAAEAPKAEEKPTDKPTAEAPKAEEKPTDK